MTKTKNIKNNEMPKTLFDKVAERSITNTIEMVTPEKAAFWLQTANTHNRPLSGFMVNRYAEIMQEGRWRENTTEPISFTPEGVLIDGQHRLAAIVKACTPVRMTISRNADTDDFKVIDTGKRRSGADTLATRGGKNTTSASCGIIFYLQLRDHGISTTTQVHKNYDNEDISDEYFSDTATWDRIAAFSSSCNKLSRATIRVQIIGGVYGYLLKVKGHKAEVIEKFFTEVATGKTNCAAVSFMNLRFIDLRNKYGGRSNASELYMIRSLARTWNHFIAGKNNTKLQVSETDIINFN